MRLRNWSIQVNGEYKNILIIDNPEPNENIDPEYLLDENLSGIFHALIFGMHIDLEEGVIG